MYYKESREWVSTQEVRSFVTKNVEDKGYRFPEFHINKDNCNQDETLYF